ncbi:MAG: helix-turn-helix transcriptional regulator [Sinobacteraceae bacterium]|nr:helix-turn-helix transcriptional regulator [Nevskiaceae bacterium]
MSSLKDKQPSERLKLLRQKLGKSQQEMAGLLQISIKGYQNYEQGKYHIPLGTIERAREHLGVNPRWLLEGIGEMFLPAAEAPGPEAERIRRTLGLDVPEAASQARPPGQPTTTQDVVNQRRNFLRRSYLDGLLLRDCLRALGRLERFRSLDVDTQADAVVWLYGIAALTGREPAAILGTFDEATWQKLSTSRSRTGS